MSSDRARTLLGWTPRRDAGGALLELIDGIRDSAGIDTPPLSPRTSGRFRAREFAGGLGARELA
jgi:hypothetical protein